MRKAGLSSVTLIALVAILALPSSASAATVVGKTNKGGSCRWETIAARAGTAITFGGRVFDCSARFGIRSVEGRGFLYEDPPNFTEIKDLTQGGAGNAPYERSATFEDGEEDVDYASVWKAAVVIRTGKNFRKPKKPERWKDPGRHCRVYSTFRSGDTLGCQLEQPI